MGRFPTVNQSDIKAYLAKIGSKGGKVSRRMLSSSEARDMAKRSHAKRRATKAKK